MSLPKPLLTGVSRSFSIEHLLPRHGLPNPVAPADQLLRFTLPPWQRPEVWTDAQKVRFIEGVFLGLGTGFYVVHASDWDNQGNPLPMSEWLIDGQQRMTAIRDFVLGEIAIFDGTRYSDISIIDLRRRFFHVPFPSIEVEFSGNESLLQELYDRLNYGGTAHTQNDQEHFRSFRETSS